MPGAPVICADCSGLDKVARRFTCGHCGTPFVRVHRGGQAVQKWLCNECEVEHRWCPRCDRILSRDEFAISRDKRDGRVSHCRRCAHEKWAATVDKDASTAAKFGLTVDEFRDLLARHNWSCAICGVPKADAPRGYLMVDHDHRCCDRDGSCGQCVRGPLCAICNFGLGSFRDDADRLLAAIQYLEFHQGVRPHEP